MSEKRRIGLKDIARELGISISTASRALNAYPGIADETIKLVKEYAEKHNYVPNTMAVNFRKNKTMTLGIVVPELIHYFFSSVISGAIQTAKKHGYSVFVSQTDEKVANEIVACRTLLSSGIDGLLISISNETIEGKHIQEFLEEGKPVVQFDKVSDYLETPKVIVDDFQGAFNAVEHLLKKGYKKIAHIGGWADVKNSVERKRGYMEALRTNGFEIHGDFLLECTDISEQEGYEFTKKLMESHNPPDAIFCITDLVAIGAIKYLKEKNFQIPEQVGVMGFSNWQLAGMVSPGLSSVDQHAYEMGVKSTEILINILRGKALCTDQTHIVKTELIIRESTSVKSHKDQEPIN
ncbi:LacI family DNA-binding transcriptional regulator [Algoriphagus winogradskyi]|uniref:Transcriptional regulator, LacI family n=1 Tax=Algoriphagus winogradskyi TaxID=237017 RepID=A0ABY1NR03_9BACT|nr:LacI family DNA-binding transcriptional regulator [Algoriphagus winogradskyi]SMP15995.1 transcriptional regulator, LacI family [Algoriphagus winogradskyi]